MVMKLPHSTLVIGGGSSGKSRFAEDLVLGSGRRPVYLATALPGDDEMRERIAQHRSRRGEIWRTVEEPLDAGRVISGCSPDEVALFECATNWLLNQISAGHDPVAASDSLIASIADAPCPVVTVSNEIGLGVVPLDPLTREFLARHGELNQMLASSSDTAVLVVAGIPSVLKGSIPN